MPDTLAQKVRAKYPGVYDDLDDATLEAQVRAKFPGVYDDIPSTGAAPAGVGALAGEAAKGFGSAFDPRPLVSLVRESWDPALGELGNAIKVADKILVAGARASWDQIQQAIGLAKEGRYVEAGGHTAAAALPFLGPAAAHAGEAIATGDPRQIARGVGEGLGQIASVVGPGVVTKVAPAVARALPQGPLIGPREPVQASALEFALRKDIPVGVGQASGNRFVQGTAANVNETLGGSFAADPARQATREAVARTGQDMAAEIQQAAGLPPAPVSGYEAGQAARAGLEQVHEAAGQAARQQYRALEAIEQRPELAQVLPVQRSAAAVAEANARMKASVGYVPTAEDLAEVARIKAELEALPYVKRTWTPAPGKTGNAAGGDWDITAGAGGAPVYRDILEAAPGIAQMTRGEVLDSLTQALETGKFTNAAKGALDVAQQRLAGRTHGISRPSLPPGAGVEYREMAWPVDITAEKFDLMPMAEEFAQARAVTGAPLMGDKATAAIAIENILKGPDQIPLSVLDDALSDLKRFAYKSERPTAGQYRMRQAVERLDARLKATAAEVGPEATRALEGARAAWSGRKLVEEMLDDLKREPGEVVGQLTARQDRHFDQLKAIADTAPEAIPQIGRAVVDDILTRATVDGGFKADRAAADWRALGPQTQQLLVGSPARAHDWGEFFTLAKRLEKDLNPSGTAKQGLKAIEGAGIGSAVTAAVLGHPVALVAEVIKDLGTYGIARVLNSPRVARVLLEGLKLPTRSAAAQAAWRTRFVRAAQAAGIPQAGQLGIRPAVAVPAAAGPTPDQPADQGRRP